MSGKNNKKPIFHFSFAARVTFIVFLCLVASVLITMGIASFLSSLHQLTANLFVFILLLLGVSALITVIIFRLVVPSVATSEQKIKDILDQIAKGNFDVKIPLTRSKYVNQTIESVNTVLQELKSVKIMRNDFISSFSHELKTPMVTINGFAELLLADDVTEEERKEYAQIIYDESRRLTKLSKNILLLNKLNAQNIVQNKSEYALDEQLRQSLSQFMREIEAKNLQVDCNAAPVAIRADADLVAQIWINLISNAIKFSPEGGTVSVSLEKQNNNAVVRIADEGCGMDEETVKHIFDQFYQGDASRTTEGNGLGLSIVRRIVELCRGAVLVRSRPDEGSVFTVILPVDS